MIRPLMASWLSLFLLCGCGQSLPETLVKSGYDEKEMEAAISRSQREIDSFITELSQPTGNNHAVKVPITDAGETEHFWLTDITFQNNEFSGIIGNEPGMVSNVKIGQTWTLKKHEASDWMFMRDGKMYGNYTMRPLLKMMPEEEAAMYRSMFAEP
jgi:uncharacterized protein YegJ (DUF2314 family)